MTPRVRDRDGRRSRAKKGDFVHSAHRRPGPAGSDCRSVWRAKRPADRDFNTVGTP